MGDDGIGANHFFVSVEALYAGGVEAAYPCLVFGGAHNAGGGYFKGHLSFGALLVGFGNVVESCHDHTLTRWATKATLIDLPIDEKDGKIPKWKKK
jgi:hypothetical protein